jgi:hypothetical protein
MEGANLIMPDLCTHTTVTGAAAYRAPLVRAIDRYNDNIIQIGSTRPSPQPSVPRGGESALLRGYPLCQGRPPRARPEGGRADPLTLCAAKAASRTGSLRPLLDPLCRQAERRTRPSQRPRLSQRCLAHLNPSSNSIYMSYERRFVGTNLSYEVEREAR